MRRPQPFAWMEGFPVLARVPLLPVEPDEAALGSTEDDTLLEAIRFASRYTGDAVRDGARVTPRLAQTLRAYDRRARMRPTPRGAFAGVQVAEVTTGPTTLRQGSAHHARTTPSAGWLTSVADRAVSFPGVLERVTLSASNLIVRRGGRFEHERVADPGDNAPERVTIRATPATIRMLAICQTGAFLRDAVAAVRDEWPSVPEQIVEHTVLTMVHKGFLLTDLLPEQINDDPLGHMLARLPATIPLRDQLVAIRDGLATADKFSPGAPERLAALDGARTICDDVVRVESPITADVAVDADFVVSETLMHDAAQAVGLLWRIGHTLPVLAAYHDRFVSRYGTDRVVPLLDIIDPVIGLGDIGEDTEIRSEPMDRDRLGILANLIATAVRQNTVEVQIDDATIAGLEGREGTAPPPPSAEIYARVLTQSSADLEAGRYHLAIDAGGTQDAGSTVGRFTSVVNLDQGGRLASLSEPALTAEVIVRPRKPELMSAAVPAGFAETRIPVGVPCKDGDLRLDDLGLVSDGGRLVLWSRSRERQIVPVLYSRVGPMYISPVVRLLQQLALSGSRPWCAWSWGPLGDTAFQPRVRYRRTILSPARWRLSPSLVAAANDAARWGGELDRWQASTVPRPPNVVVAEEGDRQLPLALDHAEDRELLRRYIRRGLDSVVEQPGGSDAVQGVVTGPSGRHLLELVIPLRGSSSPTPIDPERTLADSGACTDLYLPGGEWLSVVIPAPHSHHEGILEQLGDVVAAVAEHHDRWFWLRYENAGHGPHLRVRFHGKPELLSRHVLPAVSAWCANLVAARLASGMIVEPYEPETVRYGGPEAIDAAERVFEADGELVLATLSETAKTDQRIIAAALSMVAVVQAVADGSRDAVGSHHLDRASRRRMHGLVSAARKQAREGYESVDALGQMSIARHKWRGALDAYRDLVPMTRRADCASSVIHMHANRLLGSNDTERIARVLAAELLAREVP